MESIPEEGDLLNRVDDLAKVFYKEGYEKGLVEGVKGGFEEGYIMGVEEGSRLGEELGRLAANILLLKKKSSENNNGARLERMWKDIFSYPMNNSENESKASILHRIRSANVELCKKTGLSHLLQIENEAVNSKNNRFDF